MLRTILVTFALLLFIGRLATVAGPADATDIAGVYARRDNGTAAVPAIVVIERTRRFPHAVDLRRACRFGSAS